MSVFDAQPMAERDPSLGEIGLEIDVALRHGYQYLGLASDLARLSGCVLNAYFQR